MSGDHRCDADTGRYILTPVEDGMAASSARHGTAFESSTARARHGYDEEDDHFAENPAGSRTSTRLTAVAAPAKRHGHQVFLELPMSMRLLPIEHRAILLPENMGDIAPFPRSQKFVTSLLSNC